MVASSRAVSAEPSARDEKPRIDSCDGDSDPPLDLHASINDRLATTPAFKKLKAHERQAIYDSPIVSVALLATMHALGEHDPAMRGDAVEAANEVLDTLGVR